MDVVMFRGVMQKNVVQIGKTSNLSTKTKRVVRTIVMF